MFPVSGIFFFTLLDPVFSKYLQMVISVSLKHLRIYNYETESQEHEIGNQSCERVTLKNEIRDKGSSYKKKEKRKKNRKLKMRKCRLILI